MKAEMAVHMYAANTSIKDKCIYNSDGDLLIVPQCGTLKITTEFGRIKVSPHKICVIQVHSRGIRFSVDLDGPSRGYMLEVFKRHFVLPDLGLLELMVSRIRGTLSTQVLLTRIASVSTWLLTSLAASCFNSHDFSPLNVVAWHENYVPYKYNLDKLCTIDTVSFDHPVNLTGSEMIAETKVSSIFALQDPSIYCVLTCQTEESGNAVAEFVIFPPRWMVCFLTFKYIACYHLRIIEQAQEHTFRPPYFHRNCMSEFMGMIYGIYDAKSGGEDGFAPGGASLHSVDTPHGPDAATFLSNAQLQPKKFDGGLTFMYESTYLIKLTNYA
ncbi:putative homogentisate 1,2-dioxygenase, rmlC-like cupin domain superfamily, rmlC-like jelly roll [Plasmopara halstedii]